MAGDAEAVVRAVIDAAKGGDMTAANLILDGIVPPCRGRPVRLALPPIVGAADLVKALAAVADAMAHGVLSDEEAQAAAVLASVRSMRGCARAGMAPGRVLLISNTAGVSPTKISRRTASPSSPA